MESTTLTFRCIQLWGCRSIVGLYMVLHGCRFYRAIAFALHLYALIGLHKALRGHTELQFFSPPTQFCKATSRFYRAICLLHSCCVLFLNRYRLFSFMFCCILSGATSFTGLYGTYDSSPTKNTQLQL